MQEAPKSPLQNAPEYDTIILHKKAQKEREEYVEI
jgi:hypothetical protein